jgi:hypothetical protein
MFGTFSLSPATNALWIFSGFMALTIASIGLRAELRRSEIRFWPFVRLVLLGHRASIGLTISVAAGAYLLAILADSIRDLLHRSFWLFAQITDIPNDGSRYGPSTSGLASWLTVLVVLTVLVELQCIRALLRDTTAHYWTYLFWAGAIASFLVVGYGAGFWPYPLVK